MSHAVATGIFNMVRALADTGPNNPTFVNRWGAVWPSALLFPDVSGLVANDLSYISLPAVAVLDPERITFEVKPPDGLTAVTLRTRIKVTGANFTNGSLGVTLYQGLPTGGTGIAEYSFPTDFPGGRAAVVMDTWMDLTVVVDVGLITDVNDLWLHIRSTRGTGPSDSIIRMSWLVLDVTFPFGFPEAPAFKNYVNSLTKITNISIRTVGTAGATKYCYRVVPCDASGVCGPPSDEVVIETGHATLDATNHICLTWEDDVGATNYRIYRTCGPSNLGLGLLDTILPDLNDCGGGGAGSGFTGFKDDGSKCVTDCADIFNADDFEGCQGVTTVTYPAKETPA